MQRSVLYTIGFATAICMVCSIMVSVSAVSLKKRQDDNLLLDRRTNVLLACGLIQQGQHVSRQEVEQLFKERVHPKVIDLKTGDEVADADVSTFDQRRESTDPATSIPAPEGNKAQVRSLPKRALVFEVLKDGKPEMVVLPIEGKGLWSTLYGYLALDIDGNTVRGLTYYDQQETPGLGGEVDNPKWKALWPGRKIYDDTGAVKLHVIKGNAGTPEQDPYSIDGLSGATITSRGVSYMIDLWFGDNGFGPFIQKMKQSQPRST